ncbi:MAG: PII family protein, partial [Clostridia bacterium]|nr:PII family protein [Clostridia bacterium]
GIHEKAKLFGIAIEPEKEIILILSNKENTKEILDSIIEEVKLNDEGNGIAFVLPVEETYGLSEI